MDQGCVGERSGICLSLIVFEIVFEKLLDNIIVTLSVVVLRLSCEELTMWPLSIILHHTSVFFHITLVLAPLFHVIKGS